MSSAFVSAWYKASYFTHGSKLFVPHVLIQKISNQEITSDHCYIEVYTLNLDQHWKINELKVFKFSWFNLHPMKLYQYK